MRIEIRKSGGHACETCGATELIFAPVANANLEKDLLALFQSEVPRYRPIKRRWYKKLVAEVERATGELRDLTKL